MAMGYTNAVPEFQSCATFILQPEIPDVANVFIDDVAIKGSKTQYIMEDGLPETLAENP
ncbi:hypothetical protein AX16_000762, partial [Volvariella volvacea WC 439]